MKLNDIISANQVVQLDNLKLDKELVKEIQSKLSQIRLYPDGRWVDGDYGNRTETALREFCELFDLTNFQNDEFDKAFAEKLATVSVDDLPSPQRLTMQDYVDAAKLLGVEVEIIRAVHEVEAAGKGFLADGRPKILFERHIFFRETGGRFATSHPHLCNRRSGGYLGNEREWPRLEEAKTLDRTAALRSASWGLGQVMGFNHKLAGYDNVEDFVLDMYESESKQFKAMLGYIQSATMTMVPALKNYGWEVFARDYNGKGAVPVYAPKLEKAYDKFIILGVQQRLLHLSDKTSDSELSPGKPDGRLGAKTKSALIVFQRQQNLSQTGQVDSISIAKLKSLVSDDLLTIV
jgi:peptidoglycan hydrolase-like protein with peptidoglycan-binding domain